MARYAKQIDHFSCGPTAIINAIKWTGAPVSYRTMRQTVLKACLTTNNGTIPDHLTRGMNKIFPSYGITYRDLMGSSRGLLRHVQRGGAAIIRFRWPEYSGNHYILVTKATQHFVDVVNLYSRGQAQKRISRTTFNKLLVNRSNLFCWYLTKT